MPLRLWSGLDRRSPERDAQLIDLIGHLTGLESSRYTALKRERAQVLFDAVERAVPGALENVDLELIGSPLTHARFNRRPCLEGGLLGAARHMGTYGPLMPADAGMLPGPSTPVEGLLHCGDCTFPGIGVPAAVASLSAPKWMP